MKATVNRTGGGLSEIALVFYLHARKQNNQNNAELSAFLASRLTRKYALFAIHKLKMRVVVDLTEPRSGDLT